LITLSGGSPISAQMIGQPPIAYHSHAHYAGRFAPLPYGYHEPAMPSYEVHRVLRAHGFLPLGGPARRGGFYVISAIHPGGESGRLVIDAYTGRIESFIPRPMIGRGRGDEMVLVYQGPTFPPPDAGAMRPPPSGAPRSAQPPVPMPVPRVASRAPSDSPLVTPRPRPQAAPARPDTAQAPPVPAPVETKPAAPSPQLVPRQVEKTPAAPVVQPTKPLPPVQTLE
jgi:hypothetical protein